MAVRVTERDITLTRDAALSHVLTRDQILRLAYFASVPRANNRLRELVAANYLRAISTPFHTQHLYVAGSRAKEIVGERIARLLSGRARSPRFIRHAIALTDIRISLRTDGSSWRFEQQLRDMYVVHSATHEFRPDGALICGRDVTFVEADLGNASATKIREKFQSLHRYHELGRFQTVYPGQRMLALVVTTGSARKRHMRAMLERFDANIVSIVTFKELGLMQPDGWS